MQDYYKAVLRGEYTAVQGLNKIQAELWKLQQENVQQEQSYKMSVELNRQREQIEVYLND